MEQFNNRLIKSTTNILEIVDYTRINSDDTQYFLDSLETYV